MFLFAIFYISGLHKSWDAPSFPLKTYLFTYRGLLALTLSTVLIGYVDLGWGSMFIAVLIAAAKATLIALFFMHALVEKKLVSRDRRPMVWFLILVSLTLGDYITRGWVSLGGNSPEYGEVGCTALGHSWVTQCPPH